MSVVYPVQKLPLTLLGNAWSTFVQVVELQEVIDHIAGASVQSDSEVLIGLKKAYKEHLRTRIVRRREDAEVRVK